MAVTVFETFWSKTVQRTQKQEATEKSSVCLSASEFAELPSTPIFASRTQILSQIQLCRRFYRSSYLLKTPFAPFAYFAVRCPPPFRLSQPLKTNKLWYSKKKEKLSRLD